MAGEMRPKFERNLFLSTQALTGGREDHLTEFFASALETAPGFAQDYISFLLGARASLWGPQHIVRLRTQASDYESAIPDLVLTLANDAGVERVVAVEHKIEAQETESIRGTHVGDLDRVAPAPDPVKQLRWYLDLPHVDGVAYVRQTMKRPDDAVLGSERYIRPSSGDAHFLWRSFHPLLERHREESLVVGWLADAFVHLGWTLPNARIGDLLSDDPEIQLGARQNIRKLWQPMRTRAEDLGWRSTPGSIHEVYLTDHPTSAVKSVWINPKHYTKLVVRLTPKDPRGANGIFDALRQVATRLTESVPLANEPELAIGTQRRQGGAETVVQVTSSISDVVGQTDDVGDIERRLCDFVMGFVELVTPGGGLPRSKKASGGPPLRRSAS